MARTRNQRTTATVKHDVIDEIIAKLNELEGIEFAKDAWVNKAPEVYGVVQLSAEARQLWGDGKLLDSVYNVIVAAFVNDDDNEWVQKIQGKLEELESDGKIDLTHTNNREFDFETGKVRWQWIVMVYGPLTWTETVEVTPTETTGA